MNQRPKQILLVEDDDAARGWITRILGANGFAVVSAASAEEAWQKLGEVQSEIDLLIADMVLPGASGLDLAVALERQRPGTRTLYISGHGRSIAIESMSRASREAVLVKPFSEADLMGHVIELLTVRSDGRMLAGQDASA